MTISTTAAGQALVFALATPRTGRLQPRRDRSDFGGADSNLLKVRRIGRDYPRGDDVVDGDFGVYLGQHGGAFVVALQSILPGTVIGHEPFESLDALKRVWELD